MTSAQVESVESVVLTLAGGVALVYPPSAPIVAALKLLVEAAQEHGITPHELSVEQAGAIAAGMAAARASAITSDRARHR